MFVVVVTPNKDGKIEFTKEELQKMLDDAYAKGYSEGISRNNYYPFTVPTITYCNGETEPRPLKYDKVTCSEN